MRPLRRIMWIMRYVALAVAIAWAIVAVIYWLDLFEPNANILDSHVSPGITGPYIISMMLILLSVPYALALALVAIGETLATRRWTWRALLPILAFCGIALAIWLNATDYRFVLAYTLEHNYGWSTNALVIVPEIAVGLACGVGAVLLFIYAWVIAPHSREQAFPATA